MFGSSWNVTPEAVLSLCCSLGVSETDTFEAGQWIRSNTEHGNDGDQAHTQVLRARDFRARDRRVATLGRREV